MSSDNKPINFKQFKRFKTIFPWKLILMVLLLGLVYYYLNYLKQSPQNLPLDKKKTQPIMDESDIKIDSIIY